MIRENYNINFLIMNILLTIYGIEMVFPPVTVIFNSTLICTICLFGWIFISFINDRSYYLYQNIRITYPLIFCLVTVITPYIFGIYVIGNRYLSLALIPLGYLIFNYYKQNKRLNDLKHISIIISFFALITFYTTFRALIKSPYISRSIKSSGEHSVSLARQGIGGYSFIYFIVIASVLLLYISLKSKVKYLKIITAVSYIMSFLFILKSNYMTALLTVVIASIVLILSNYIKAGGTNIIIFVSLVIAIFVVLTNLDVIINKYSDFIPERIANIVVTDSNQGMYEAIFDEFINDRWPTMLSSIRMLIKYPIFGILGSGEFDMSFNGSLAGFGQHSHIIDTFALYGFFIGIINIFIILKPFRDENGNRIKYGNALNSAIMVCTIVIYLFNNATPSIAFALGILFPLLRETYTDGGEI